MNDRNERLTLPAIPPGFALIRSGAIKPDDLVYAWPAGSWERADSPAWLSRVNDAGDAIAVIRKGVFDSTGYGPGRRYTINRGPLTPDPAAVNAPKGVTLDGNAAKRVARSAQQSLFGE